MAILATYLVKGGYKSLIHKNNIHYSFVYGSKDLD